MKLAFIGIKEILFLKVPYGFSKEVIVNFGGFLKFQNSFMHLKKLINTHTTRTKSGIQFVGIPEAHSLASSVVRSQTVQKSPVFGLYLKVTLALPMLLGP